MKLCSVHRDSGGRTTLSGMDGSRHPLSYDLGGGKMGQ